MKKNNLDISIAYISIFLILLTPIYFVLYLVMCLANIAINEWCILIISIVLSLITVIKSFKIYYD